MRLFAEEKLISVRQYEYVVEMINSTPHERRRGIQIGNLISQFFANAYLNGFDHFLQQSLGCWAYLRFSDDFLVVADDKTWLSGLLAQMQSYLNRLRLWLHPHKCQVMPTRCGVEFLGWLVYPDHRRLRRSTGVRFQRRLRQRIGEVIRRSGDARLIGLFRESRRRKLASELTECEAAIVIEMYARNRQWSDIFALLFQIPLASAVGALDVLGKSGWRPSPATICATPSRWTNR